MDDFAQIYQEYRKGARNFGRYMDRMQAKAGPGQLPFQAQRNVTIKAIGVFETVGSLGLPRSNLVDFFNVDKKFDFYDTQLSSGIHILPYQPNAMN